MNDKELIKEFIFIEKSSDEVKIIVKEIIWPQTHTPSERFKVAKSFHSKISEEQLESEIQKILKSKKYFGTCSICNEKNPNGWMHDDKTCQSCAEEHLGVTY